MGKEQKRIWKKNRWGAMAGTAVLTVCLTASETLAGYSEKANAASIDQNNAVIAAVAATIIGIIAFVERHRTDR